MATEDILRTPFTQTFGGAQKMSHFVSLSVSSLYTVVPELVGGFLPPPPLNLHLAPPPPPFSFYATLPKCCALSQKV